LEESQSLLRQRSVRLLNSTRVASSMPEVSIASSSAFGPARQYSCCTSANGYVSIASSSAFGPALMNYSSPVMRAHEVSIASSSAFGPARRGPSPDCRRDGVSIASSSAFGPAHQPESLPHARDLSLNRFLVSVRSGSFTNTFYMRATAGSQSLLRQRSVRLLTTPWSGWRGG